MHDQLHLTSAVQHSRKMATPQSAYPYHCPLATCSRSFPSLDSLSFHLQFDHQPLDFHSSRYDNQKMPISPVAYPQQRPSQGQKLSPHAQELGRQIAVARQLLQKQKRAEMRAIDLLSPVSTSRKPVRNHNETGKISKSVPWRSSFLSDDDDDGVDDDRLVSGLRSIPLRAMSSEHSTGSTSHRSGSLSGKATVDSRSPRNIGEDVIDKWRAQREIRKLEDRLRQKTNEVAGLQAQVDQCLRVAREKEGKVAEMTAFLEETATRQSTARQALRNYIDNLVDRAEKAENEVDDLKSMITLSRTGSLRTDSMSPTTPHLTQQTPLLGDSLPTSRGSHHKSAQQNYGKPSSPLSWERKLQDVESSGYYQRPVESDIQPIDMQPHHLAPSPSINRKGNNSGMLYEEPILGRVKPNSSAYQDSFRVNGRNDKAPISNSNYTDSGVGTEIVNSGEDSLIKDMRSRSASTRFGGLDENLPSAIQRETTNSYNDPLSYNNYKSSILSKSHNRSEGAVSSVPPLESPTYAVQMKMPYLAADNYNTLVVDRGSDHWPLSESLVQASLASRDATSSTKPTSPSQFPVSSMPIDPRVRSENVVDLDMDLLEDALEDVLARREQDSRAGMTSPYSRVIPTHGRGRLSALDLAKDEYSGARLRDDLSESAVSVTSRSQWSDDLEEGIHKSKGNSLMLMDPNRRRAALTAVFLYLDTSTLLKCASVCKEWKEVSRQPVLWQYVHLRNRRISSKFLKTISKWCSELKWLVMEKLSPRKQRETEDSDAYHNKIRGSLEPGLERLLQAAGSELLTIKIVDCPDILTERSLWLLSCHSRNLRSLTYISATDPVGPEVIWALGAGCRQVESLKIPPKFPCKKPKKFNGWCLAMIGRCWSRLQALSVGGKLVDLASLATVTKHCSKLQVLELDHMSKITEEVAVKVCRNGLRGLHTLILRHTPITPSAILHFNGACPQLTTILVHLSLSDFFTPPASPGQRKEFSRAVATLLALTKRSCLTQTLQIRTDYK